MAGSAYEEKILSATRRTGIATLAAAMIAASGKPFSIEETAELFHDLERAIYPPQRGPAGDFAPRLSP
jgi:hypothetical protein